MRIPPPTAHRLLDRLVAAGVTIRRRPAAGGQPQLLLSLRGRALRERFDALRAARLQA